MSDGTITGKITDLIVEQLGLDREGDYESDKFLSATWEDLQADSLDVIELIMALEEAFAVEIPTEPMDLDKLKTVQDLIDAVQQALTAKAGG